MMYAFWTEHEFRPGSRKYPSERFPDSAEITAVGIGAVLIPCTERPALFVLRGLYPTARGAKRAMNSLNKASWKTWLASWKKRAQHNKWCHRINHG
jgi:hypothetical protein